MAKQYRIHIRGRQRAEIDADLMAQLVVLMGRQLAAEARQTEKAKSQPDNEAEGEHQRIDKAAGTPA